MNEEQYLIMKVKSASREDHLVMLYDLLLQDIDEAEISLSGKGGSVDLAQAGFAVARAINVLTELNRTLDFRFNPGLCSQLNGLYVFFTRELSAALKEANPVLIQNIIPMITGLRDTWAQARDLVNNQAQAA